MFGHCLQETKCLWNAIISPHSCFILFKDTWKVMEIALSPWPIARKKLNLVSVYQGTLVGGFVNISLYFNKLANKIQTAVK